MILTCPNCRSSGNHGPKKTCDANSCAQIQTSFSPDRNSDWLTCCRMRTRAQRRAFPSRSTTRATCGAWGASYTTSSTERCRSGRSRTPWRSSRPSSTLTTKYHSPQRREETTIRRSVDSGCNSFDLSFLGIDGHKKGQIDTTLHVLSRTRHRFKTSTTCVEKNERVFKIAYFFRN